MAITSSKPQTTRRAIRGIVHADTGQLIIVDTPGIHRPRTLLGQRLNDLVSSTLSDVDVIAMCFPANEDIGPGDRFINEQLDSYPRAIKVAIVTKIDTVGRDHVGVQLLAVAELREWATIIPVSAIDDIQLDVVTRELHRTDARVSASRTARMRSPTRRDEDRIAELIREAALEGVSTSSRIRSP